MLSWSSETFQPIVFENGFYLSKLNLVTRGPCWSNEFIAGRFRQMQLIWKDLLVAQFNFNRENRVSNMQVKNSEDMNWLLRNRHFPSACQPKTSLISITLHSPSFFISCFDYLFKIRALKCSFVISKSKLQLWNSQNYNIFWWFSTISFIYGEQERTQNRSLRNSFVLTL